jgi:CDP-diacylglycerol--glycerol-3-phosphate 3-phosphatidyltransferase
MVWLMGVLARLEAAAPRLGLTPDVLNFVGLGFGIFSGALICLNQPEGGALALGIAGVADVLDGRIARRMGLVSRYGQFIDSTLDRFVEVAVLLALAYYLRGHPWGPQVAAAALAGSLLVSYTRARGESVGVVCTVGLMPRAVRLVLTLVACLFDRWISMLCGAPAGSLLILVLIMIALGTFSTAVYRTYWIARRLRSHPA